MESKIRVLDEHTINKIAAGEVIENPASVVKELIENSLDAGSSSICVEIKCGGRQLIRVTDDGCGMSPDDALLCLERHATSKIRDVEDIFNIYTMGFRGEAIPSIASISKFNLITSQGNEKGTMVIVEGGKIIECCQAARSKGTTIEVKSLFFNIPVRRKFQKSPNYDANEIFKTISTVALGHPSVQFQLISDQKTILNTTTIDKDASEKDRFEQRVKDILGNDFFETTKYIEEKNDEIELKGFISYPSFTRNNRTGQYTFINQRPIFSAAVAYAVRDGYGTALSTNRYPLYVLHLSIPGNIVDVNVHPQKREVRLRQEQLLRETIVQSVQKGIQQNISTDFQKLSFPLPVSFSSPVFDTPSIALPSTIQSTFIEKKENPISLPPLPPLKMTSAEKEKIPENEPTFLKQAVTVLGTIQSYILVDSFLNFGSHLDGFCLIDQRAAHSRIIFERLLNAQQEKKVEMQTLLIPYTFSVSPIEKRFLLEQLQNLLHQGISIQQSGPNTFFVDALANFFDDRNIKSLVDGIINSLQIERNDSLIDEQKRMAQMAANASIHRGNRLLLEEAQSLISQLSDCKIPFQCPLGKPTIIHIKSDELIKRFQKGLQI